MQGEPLFFHLFGMGSRRKFVYRDGVLSDALFGDVLYRWQVRNEKLDRENYRVTFTTLDGWVTLFEDEEAFWIEDHNGKREISRGLVRLPDFAGHPRAGLLRALHADLLCNILPWGPVPNLWVYQRPWYRDAAMMALCFERTGNAHLLVSWIESLFLPYDRNNRGHDESDNLGQLLYLASLAKGAKTPIVETVLKEIPNRIKNGHLTGTTDHCEHPVYQTKWLKYGLNQLGLDDPYVIPQVADSYSSLFWMDYRDQHVPHPRFDAGALEKYPYLNWAEAHFYDEPPPEPFDSASPTREIESTEAYYARMDFLNPDWPARKYSTPHTWHAAEIFLYFLDYPNR